MKLLIVFLAVVAAFSSSAAACPGDDSQAPPLTKDKRFNLVEVTDLGVAGRAQDGNLKPETIYRAIYGDPRASVPKLIASLTDVRKTRKPVLCPIVSYTTAGDVAFMILGDM